jgi:hypothetical protein
MELQD